MRIHLLLAVGVLGVILCGLQKTIANPDPVATEVSTQDEIARLIRELGDSRWKVRKAATQRLREIGRPAVTALRKAQEHKDPEIAYRARQAIKEINRRLEARRGELRQSAEEAAKKGNYAKAKGDYLALLDLPEPPLRDCYSSVRLFEAHKDWVSLAVAYEVTAESMWRVIHMPAEAFVRPPAEEPGRAGVLERGGPYVQVQINLDGVWGNGKGNAEHWIPWIQRKQKDLRLKRIGLLKKLGQMCLLRLSAPDRAVAAYEAAGRGIPLHTESLEKMIPQMWPKMRVKADKVLALDQAGAAHIRIEVLDGLAEAQVAAGNLRGAAETRLRAMLAMLIGEKGDWNAHGASSQAEAFWKIVRRLPITEPLPPTLWIHVLDRQHPDLILADPEAGPHGLPLSFHGPNLVIRPGQKARTLTVSAVEKPGGNGGIRCFTTINGKIHTLGWVQWHEKGRPPGSLQAGTFKVPKGAGIIRLRITRYNGTDFHVHNLKVSANFVEDQPAPTGASSKDLTTHPAAQ